MTNCNPETGIRYGVIAFNSLADWCNDELFYGPNATDLSYQDALEDLNAEGKRAYANLLEEAGIAAAESGADRELGFDSEVWEERWFEAHDHEFDAEDYVLRYVERHSENLQIDEPVIEGECDGVKYSISWLGGAPLLWVLEGPLGCAERLCSPCVPNAADLDSGFLFLDVPPSELEFHQGFVCYCVPRDWLRKEQA